MIDRFHELLKKPFAVMGVLNVTPDSFYDGGEHRSVRAAVDHAMRLIDEGADVIDIGGESTRPGSESVSAKDECARVTPVVEELAKKYSCVLSVDTSKSEVAKSALDAGASWINDISAGRFDPEMASVVAHYQCPCVLMHSRATPQTMQIAPSYDNVLEEVAAELSEAVERFVSSGVERDRIILDPGIGFAKRHEDNLALLAHIDKIVSLGFPVLLGTSRKSFIGRITGSEVQDRLWGTLGSEVYAFLRGVKLFRVHDVRATVDCLKVVDAIAEVR